WETVERHLELAKVVALQRKRNVWVVTPRVAVHDGLTVDPGLIDINIGYAWMCAADVMTDFNFTPVAPPEDSLPTVVTDPTSVLTQDPTSLNVLPTAPPPPEGQFVDHAND